MDSSCILDLLDEPWRSRARSIFCGLDGGPSLDWEDCKILCGTFWSRVDDCFEASLFPFVKGYGFRMDESAIDTKVVIHDSARRSLSIASGEVCIFAGPLARLEDGTWKGENSVTILRRTSAVEHDAIECLHLFAGAFSGWSQATFTIPWILPQTTIGTQVFVDLDSDVIAALSMKFGIKSVHAPLAATQAFEITLNRVIQGDVADPTILHCVQPLSNLVFSASPPCVSWSKGGIGRGLNCPDGWAFVEAIKQCAIGQPVLVVFECVDALALHSHFKIITSMLRDLGYVGIWDDVVHYHTFVHMHRSRWLACFVRHDIVHHGPKPVPSLKSVSPERWNSESFRFQLPRSLSDQIAIPSQVQSVYAQHSFLPPAKRAKFDPAAPAEVILRARFLQPHEPVPTVCAAYGFQHLLPRHLLEQKGIFATLKDGDAGPEFLDPALLAAMLGLFEPAVLSNQLQLLYRQIGNSIATPHALMALLAGLDYLFQWGLDVNGAINKVWQRRIVGQKAIIIEQREFYILAGLDPIIEQITVRSDLVTNDSHVTLHCRHVNGRSAYLTVKLAWTVSDLLKCFTWKFDISAHVYIAATGEKLFPSQTVGQIFEQYHEWTLFVRTFPIASLSICKDYDTCVPTQAWHGPQPLCDAIHDQPADPFRLKPVGDDDLFADTQFQFALSLLESNCLQASSLSATTFTVTFGTTPCTLTFNGFGDSEARLRCIRGLWDHLDQDTQLFAFKICEHGDLSRLPPHGVIFPKFTEDRLVLLQFGPQDTTSGFFIPARLEGPFFEIGPYHYRLMSKNGNDLGPPPFYFDHGDFLHLTLQNDIHCGGHHGTRSTTIPAGANLLQRAEFASNTGGWLASDEMAFFLRQLTWLAPEFAIFHPAVRWNLETANLDANDYQEILIANNRLNILPILSGSHWLAFEIQREGANTHVTFVGLPGPLLRSGLQVVADLLDITPERIQYSHVPLDDVNHFCGWALLHRWATAAGMLDHMPLNGELYATTSIAARDIIDDVIEDSIEDWNQNGIPYGLWFFAATLRRAFFSFLATTTLRGNAVLQEAITVVFDDIAAGPQPEETPP